MTADAAYLITGIPGAGKTTVARALADRLAPAAHLEGDAIGDLIVSGRVRPGEHPEAEAGRQLTLRTRNIGLLADSYFAAGITPIIDDVVVGDRLAEFTTAVTARPLLLVVLAPPVEVALQRDSDRPEKTVAAQWTHLAGLMRADLGEVGLWIDTARLTVGETVAIVVERAAEGAL